MSHHIDFSFHGWRVSTSNHLYIHMERRRHGAVEQQNVSLGLAFGPMSETMPGTVDR